MAETKTYYQVAVAQIKERIKDKRVLIKRHEHELSGLVEALDIAESAVLFLAPDTEIPKEAV